MTKLPEPTYFTWIDYESKVHHQPYYTEAQMLAFRNQALEEAAKACLAQWLEKRQTPSEVPPLPPAPGRDRPLAPGEEEAAADQKYPLSTETGIRQYRL